MDMISETDAHAIKSVEERIMNLKWDKFEQAYVCEDIDSNTTQAKVCKSIIK